MVSLLLEDVVVGAGYFGDEVAEDDVVHCGRFGFGFDGGEFADGVLDLDVGVFSVGVEKEFGGGGGRLYILILVVDVVPPYFER
jgi:hypothetical protein